MSDFIIPQASSTVTVRVLDTVAPDSSLPAYLFVDPVKPGKEKLYEPDYAFLVEHHASGRKIMFDLGPMKDFRKLSQAMRGMLSQAPFDIRVNFDIVEQLQVGGISLSGIDTVIWSHSHFDHTGDMSLWPSTTKLVIGKGTDRRVYPETPDALLLASDYAGREVVVLDFSKADLIIGGTNAHDFFGDGSFYLLDMPGHWPGHLSALARVKSSSFVLLGGDTCHHPGQIRPNVHLHKHIPCPGGLLTNSLKPPLGIPEVSMYADRVTALTSQEKLGILEAHPDIFLISAHDASLETIIKLFPESVDDWKEHGLKEKAVWAFLDEGNKAFGYF
ncbi:hypothetical protein D9757_009210 [Collybiopsis confluens]|uniref:Metallo-beta-lactamase domain-containing protein n=1 Tax=Collybiopsis confluens TaxID=2823264 RepID=A0A8H5HAF3_9AGAR|nr:hypothetical protein D9757_009210 [Collybiopsis confluens]